MELTTFSIPAFRRADIEKRLKKLARKAVKYGNEDISYRFGSSYSKTIETENGPKTYEFVDISVSGEAPRIAGWELLARIELLSEVDENLIHVMPGSSESLDDEFRFHKGHCDHCNTNRRRNDVYVLFDGVEQIAVGRSCLRDFLGIDDPKKLVHRAQFFEELRSMEEDDMIGSFGGYGYEDLFDVLSITAAYIRERGYVSKKMQQDKGYATTGETVKFTLRGLKGYEVTLKGEDKEWAKKTINYFRSQDSFGNEYLDNLRILLKQDIVKDQHINLVASSVITAQRKLAPKVEGLESTFVGEVKERMKGLKVILEKIIFLGVGQFGSSYLHLMKDLDGNAFSWITSSKLEFDEGTELVVDGTVKQHKIYNDVKQTVLTRVKVK